MRTTLLRPELEDLRVIALNLGRVLEGLSLWMLPPLLLALVLREWNAASALAVGIGTALLLGGLAVRRFATDRPLTLALGSVVVSLAWLVGAAVLALPIHLSGHTARFLDAWFEAMSGLTATGLSLVQDVDHLALSIQLHRHLLMLLGGTGIVIVVIALFSAGGGVGSLYRAEGREERILPNVIRTARFIFAVSGVYLVIGSLALMAALALAGITGWRGAYHAVTLFLSAFNTGGFSPTSQSLAYYHSGSVELIIVVLLLVGGSSFLLHRELWTGKGRTELRSSLEVRTFATTLAVGITMGVVALAVSGTYRDTIPLWRKGAFTMVSSSTGGGFTVTSGTAFLADWGQAAPFVMVVLMALGGMAGATAGGIKMIRLGLVAKGLVHDVRRLLAPSGALVVTTFHVRRRTVLGSGLLRSAAVVLLLYVATYLFGAIVGLAYGRWTLSETLFESVSATANAGLSVGIAQPGMPIGLEVVYLLQMWIGRLEFIAVFVLGGFALSLVRGRG
ncbi:MAG: hypothetical protein RLZZ272_40 [Actinomycetota bacterium]